MTHTQIHRRMLGEEFIDEPEDAVSEDHSLSQVGPGVSGVPAPQNYTTIHLGP